MNVQRPLATLRGHIDAAHWDGITGWAFDPEQPDRRVPVEVMHEDRVLLRTVADRHRPDLEAAGFGDGAHSFALSLPMSLFTAPVVCLRLVEADTGIDLAGSPVVLHNDHAVPDPATLDAFERAVAGAAEGARHADDLGPLWLLLLRGFDLVSQRRASLEASNEARLNRFVEAIGDRSLSQVIHDAAGEVLRRYRHVHLPEVEEPDVSVIIPVHGAFKLTHQCLDSIARHLPRCAIEVIVVDDCSTDETVYAGMVFSGAVRVLRNASNLGFVGTVTAGAAVARGRHLLLLNNDTEVTPGWADELADTLDRDPSIGVAGSKLVYPDGRLQECGGIIWRAGDGWNWGRFDDPERPRYCVMRDADYVSGAALMISRALWDEVGGLSPEFAPAYYEDTDLCFKVRAAGRRVVVQPLSRIVHHEGASAGTDVNGSGMKRFQRVNRLKFVGKWSHALAAHEENGADPDRAAERAVRRRALFIDETVPTPDRDAGSNAAMEHMLSLQRLGFKVHFVPSDNMARISPYTEGLERLGIQSYHAPFFWSVEEVLRREAATFDLIYLHRVVNAAKYGAMLRRRYPGARIVYNVADLHHLRAERQAALAGDAALAAEAARIKETELAAARACDAVIVHSTHEADTLAEAGVAVPVSVVPWVVPARPPRRPFARRRGLAFVGGYNHPPNVDAAEWLVREIMPLVWDADPSIELHLIGDRMPDGFKAMARPGLRLVGWVRDLAPALEELRLTVAPLRYGAGLKGKVLTSLAAGLPCVATPCAAEGMELPGPLAAGMVADTPAAIASRILLLHGDEAENAALSAAGLEYVAGTCSQARVDALVARAAGLG